MKTIKLHIDHSTKPQTLAGELKKKNLQKGDLLIIKSLLECGNGFADCAGFIGPSSMREKWTMQIKF